MPKDVFSEYDDEEIAVSDRDFYAEDEKSAEENPESGEIACDTDEDDLKPDGLKPDGDEGKGQPRSEEDEKYFQKLIEYHETHNLKLRNEIVMYYSPLAKKIAVSMRGVFGDYAQIEDIVNQGILALIECVERYDPTRQAKFSSYAYMRMRGAVIDFVRRQDWIPRRVRTNAKTLSRAHDELCNELMREPTDEELSQRLGMDVDTLNRSYGEISGSVTVSLESTIQGIYLSDKRIDPEDSSNSIDSGIMRSELKEQLAAAIEGLTNRERQVVTLYYYENLKQGEIAQTLDISEQRVSQLLAKAIQRMTCRIKTYMQGDL